MQRAAEWAAAGDRVALAADEDLVHVVHDAVELRVDGALVVFIAVPTMIARPCPAATLVPMKIMLRRSASGVVSSRIAEALLTTATLSPVNEKWMWLGRQALGWLRQE